METKHGPPWTRNNGYETLDFILVPERWKNSVLDAESDTTGFLPSDHYPVIAKIRINLKAEKPQNFLQRPKFLKAIWGER